jgi:hypothetical protein
MPTRQRAGELWDWVTKHARRVARDAAFFVPAVVIAAGVVVPVLVIVASLAIWLVNEPGSVFDVGVIGDFALVAVGAAGLAVIAALIAKHMGFRNLLASARAVIPAFLAGLAALVIALGAALWLQEKFGRPDHVQSRLEVGFWIGAVALVVVVTLVALPLRAVQKKAGIPIRHLYLTPLVWLGLAAAMLAVVGEKPSDVAKDASEKEKARLEGKPRPRNAAALAYKHRPLLHFDREETYRPLDVDEFFAELGPDYEPSHDVCSEDPFGYDCASIRSAEDLDRLKDDPRAVIAIDANPAKDPPTPGRIYYHADAARDGRVHIDYWIFYRYNDSPKFSKYTCLSGLSVKDLTCFDHEGDWEGITVTLKPDGEPESVAYAGHHWLHRFDWEDLEHVGVIRGDRPRVWVAEGSHASYPAPCGKVRRGTRVVQVGCDQPTTDVPDGDRSPRDDEPWPCGKDCVRELPLTEDGRPTGWAAFAGYWGAPRCTVGTRLCTRSLGPDTPAYQDRYRWPGRKEPEPRLLRQWYGDAARKLPSLGGA